MFPNVNSSLFQWAETLQTSPHFLAGDRVVEVRLGILRDRPALNGTPPQAPVSICVTFCCLLSKGLNTVPQHLLPSPLSPCAQTGGISSPAQCRSKSSHLCTVTLTCTKSLGKADVVLLNGGMLLVGALCLEFLRRRPASTEKAGGIHRPGTRVRPGASWTYLPSRIHFSLPTCESPFFSPLKTPYSLYHAS